MYMFIITQFLHSLFHIRDHTFRSTAPCYLQRHPRNTTSETPPQKYKCTQLQRLHVDSTQQHRSFLRCLTLSKDNHPCVTLSFIYDCGNYICLPKDSVHIYSSNTAQRWTFLRKHPKSKFRRLSYVSEEVSEAKETKLHVQLQANSKHAQRPPRLLTATLQTLKVTAVITLWNCLCINYSAHIFSCSTVV